MEPWDGPASIAFTDGIRIGAVLDRNGLRPSRYYVTKDDLVVMASEVGVLDIPPERDRCTRAACSRAACSWSTLEQGRIIADEEIKQQIAAEQPYGEWLRREPRLAGRPARRRRAVHRARSRDRAAAPAGLRLHHRGSARS